ncbi:MAG: hypothetical protein Q4G43_08410 [Mobilicoccus sp.]|nr:hypothetical protein [Mobilicoccus sp.]
MKGRLVAPLAAAAVVGVAATAAYAADIAPPQARVVVPAIQMDSAGARVATAPGGSSIETLGSTDLLVAPVSVSIAPRAPTTAADVAAMRPDLGVDLVWGTDNCTDLRWAVAPGGFDDDLSAVPETSGEDLEPLPAGETRYLCARARWSGDEDERTQRYAGRVAVASTQWRSSTPAPASWNSVVSTNAVISVPLPAPAPAERACTNAPRSVSLAWTWPTPGSSPIEGADAIDRWTVHVRAQGSDDAWTPVLDTTSASARTASLFAERVRGADLPAGTYEVMLRAYPFADTDDGHVDSEGRWTVTVPSAGPARCGGDS